MTATLSRPRAAAAGRASGPIGGWAFAGVAVSSFGGPLALAALYAPSIGADATASAGLTELAAVGAFTVPLAVWLWYARRVNGPGGLYGFVEAAAGRRLALGHAALWIVSYLLYLLATTAQIVYDTLPAVLPGERRYQSLLAVAIPVALAGVMVAGRAAALAVTGVLAVGQLGLTGVLAAVTAAQVSTPVSTFGAGAPAAPLATASGQTALLFVCGSLPLFLGGEVRRPVRTVRRGLVGGYLASAAVIVAAVAPYAAAPALARQPIPGVAAAEAFGGHGFAVTIAIGVAASIAGVMLVEYLALSRLLHALTSRPLRRVITAIGALLVVAAPITLLDPERIYEDLVKPSLVALWLSQLVVFAVFPRFATRHGARPATAWGLALGSTAFAGYGLWATLHHVSS